MIVFASMALITSIYSATCSSWTVSFPLRASWIFSENIDSILLLCSSEVSFQMLNLFSIFLNNSSFWQLLVNFRLHYVLCSVSILQCTQCLLRIYRCGRNCGNYWCSLLFSKRLLKDSVKILCVSFYKSCNNSFTSQNRLLGISSFTSSFINCPKPKCFHFLQDQPILSS